MEKTEMMKRYESETGKQSAIVKFMVGGQALEPKSYPKLGPYDYSTDYIAWLESKATAYDRLMSGGKKTPKEVANFFGFPIAMNKYGAWYTLFPTIPIIAETGFWYSQVYPTGRFSHSIPTIDQIDFTGDWKESLTLPDGWEA